jgi:metal-responsive CopG/Arc/MetJ family transcriptional regulator
MDAQLTVRIPKHLREALDRASQAAGLKNSDLVRRVLQSYLALPDEREKRPAERVRDLIGCLDSGVPDLAENQRAYIIESLTSGE